MSAIGYFLGFNVLYFCAIAPNHDVAEVAVTAQTREREPKVDWGEAQVDHKTCQGGFISFHSFQLVPLSHS